MYVVVDSNKVFSALLSKGKAFDIFWHNGLVHRISFVAPELLFTEIRKHLDEIHKRSKLPKQEIEEVFSFIQKQVAPLPHMLIRPHMEEADKLAPHSKDSEYFATALALDAGIWSDEAAFRRQFRVKIYSSGALRKELGLP
jgi:predicted nucleic acid-binding protein